MTMIVSKENLIRLPEVQRRTGYSKAWIYKLISAGEFPKQIKLGSRSVAFIESEIDNWIAQRIAESRAA
ncbi:helix-turn-helix transcriptional regulator [Xenorhabdus eapokensis]|uniref:Dipicolinate synthase n=1 Tax=Xenorhabdus eapokensis TaxID=1873482 RepID=A0A1Q5TK91_9GAMM|nr:AlpA family transcriptional regulator [Xenorhabdus eapokensis]OKP00648.1 dipicolinate synthase [Xenorhabdus eapokensis]